MLESSKEARGVAGARPAPPVPRLLAVSPLGPVALTSFAQRTPRSSPADSLTRSQGPLAHSPTGRLAALLSRSTPCGVCSRQLRCRLLAGSGAVKPPRCCGASRRAWPARMVRGSEAPTLFAWFAGLRPALITKDRTAVFRTTPRLAPSRLASLRWLSYCSRVFRRWSERTTGIARTPNR